MRTRALWQKGIPLGEADFQFAPTELRQTHDAVIAAQPVFPSSGAVDWQQLLTELKQVTDTMTKTVDLRERMRRQLLRLLSTGQLVAYGFHVPRHPKDIPTEVPSDLFEKRFVDWKTSAINGHGLEFVAVRVLHPSWVRKIQSLSPKELPAPTPVPRRGPQQKNEHIAIAVALLFQEGKLDPKAPHKANVPPIRERVRELFPGEFVGDKGLSDETIRRVMLSVLRRLAVATLESQNLKISN